MPNVDRLRFSTTTTEARSVRYDTPISLDTVVDLQPVPNNLMRTVMHYEAAPPRDREEFMYWYLVHRLEDSGGMSSRDVQAAIRDAEDVWRFVSGESDDLAERAEREQLWSRTYVNALERRKGNAVVAFTIRC